MIVETLVQHGSDFIEWLDASGPQPPARRTLPALGLDVLITHGPADLSLLHKASCTALWRRRPEQLQRTVDGSAPAAELDPPAQALYLIRGKVRDFSGAFLPRHFTLEAGGGTGHRLRLFRSPLGTRFGSAGGLYGSTSLDDGTPVPWALLSLRVTPPLAEPVDFVAQSDERGEFRLSLERLPALTRDAPAHSYPATLTLQAAAGGTDPDSLPRAQVLDSASSQFKGELALEIAPGRISALASAGRGTLILRLT